MLALAPQDAITQLDRLVASARLPARHANRCAHLAETLRRPARVCLLGPVSGDIGCIVQGFLGAWDLPCDRLPPAVEVQYGSEVRSSAMLEDGATLAHGGMPTEETLQRNPVFLQIELPLDRLLSMSFLVLSLEADPTMHRPALSWAARRSEIAVWCTPSFREADAGILRLAPERLNQHAYLLETRPDAVLPQHDATSNFIQTFGLASLGGGETPPDIKPLIDRLTADIEDARVADLDMAQLFLHNFGHMAPRRGDSADEACSSGGTLVRQLPEHDLRPLLSEPLLYLMERANDLAAQLEPERLTEDWATSFLSHCTDTAGGLRDRAENWPDDIGPAQFIQAMIGEICDMTMLLKIEGGTEQAQDATAMLFQLRLAFEQALGWEAE